MTIIHCVLSMSFVSLGDKPAEWPDLFGDVSEVINIRAFFTRYWHTLQYRGFVEFAKIISLHFLQLGQGNVFAGFAIRGFVFLFSGLVHGYVSWLTRDKCSVMPETYEYLQFALAVMIEDLVICLYQTCFGRVCNPWARVGFQNLGRVWVFAVMFFVVADAGMKKNACIESLRSFVPL
jgi:hypothetical protein